MEESTSIGSYTSLDEAHLDAVAQVEQQLSVLFGRARLVWKESAAQIHPDLQPVGYKILSAIVSRGQTTAMALAEALETDKSVVSRQVRLLEEFGLVTGRADETDGRARVLSATQRGSEKVRAVRSRHQDRLRTLLQSQPEADVRAFAAMLQLITEV
jgi:DNA-binding MarR family transcriptional regulator